MSRRVLGVTDRLVLAAPYLWLLLFFLAPFLIVLKLSFSQPALAQPPYTPVFNLFLGVEAFVAGLGELSLDAYSTLVGDGLYFEAYFSSVRLAAVSTALTLCVAYPLAYAMARAPERWRVYLVILAIAPFWTSFLIRVYAWIAILKDEGLLNMALIKMGLISEPLHLFATDWAVLIGIVYSYLPFMVLPIYNAIAKQDSALLEAAQDLGATPLTTFWRIVFPLSRAGIVAGCLLVFIPAVGEFVIPDLLGGSETLMIGRTLWVEFFENRDWPTACAVAVVLLTLLLIPLWFHDRAQSKQSEPIG
jgi:putrescine transport system permease protein